MITALAVGAGLLAGPAAAQEFGGLAMACTPAAPISVSTYDAAPSDGKGAHDVDPRGEFAEFRNGDATRAVDLGGCVFVVVDAFTETVTYVASATGRVEPGATVSFATVTGGGPGLLLMPAGTLPDGPGSFALLAGSAAVGEPLQTLLQTAAVVASVVYFDDDRIVGKLGGGSAVATEASEASDLSVVVAPNPVSASGQVSFGLVDGEAARVSLVDALGREVAVLADGAVGPGRHTVRLPVAGLPAGLYVVRVATGTAVRTARLVVAR